MQGLVRSDEQNRGRKGGRRYVYDITDDPRDIIAAVRESSYSEALPGNVESVLTYYLEDESSGFEAPVESDEKQQHLWEFT
jgi:cell division control protein 6